MTNILLGMARPSQTGIWGDKDNPLYSRTTLVSGPPNDATANNAVYGINIAEGGASLTITLSQTFKYLVVACDGQNGGVAVFDVSSLQIGDQIVLARYASPENAGTHGDLEQAY